MSYKIKNSKKKGYKELTLSIKFVRQWKVTDREVEKILSYMESDDDSIGGDLYWTVVDYKTGKSLEGKNKQNVTVKKVGDWKYSTPKEYYGAEGVDGPYIWLSDASVKIKITYPKNYKGLCIGVGGNTSIGDTKNNTKFWEGKAAFGKTSFYSKKDKAVAHFMRVTK